MALGTTLAGLLVMLRAEARLSQSVAAGINNDLTLRTLLARHQDNLWLARDWKHLEVSRDIETQGGTRLYTWPSDLSFDRAVVAKVKWSGQWMDLSFGINEPDYNEMDPDLGTEQDPARRWDFAEGDKMEMWPTPATDGTIVRLVGTKALPPLVADGDTAILDDRLIVLFAAAELLALQKAPDAQAKLSAANMRLLALSGRQAKRKVHSMLAGQRRGFGHGGGTELRVINGRGSAVTWDGSGLWGE